MNTQRKNHFSKILSMFRKRNIIIVLILVVVMGGYFYFKSRNTVVVVQTETVRRGDVVETVSVTGTLEPEVYADMSFLGAGTVDGVFVQTGERVTVGQKIASLDRLVLFSQLKEARIAVIVAEQNELSARKNRGHLYTPEDIQAKRFLSEQARERARILEAQMKENVLVSPMTGKISKFDARVGEVVTPGKVIARVVGGEGYLLESRVPESDIVKMSLGMKARITFDALSPDDVFEGTIEGIDPSSTVVQDVVSYKVQFRLVRGDDRLKEGMTGNIDAETAKRTGVLWVPFRALTKEGTQTFAEVRQPDLTFKKVEVTTGLEGDDGTIEVKTGLKEGEAVTIGATQKK